MTNFTYAFPWKCFPRLFSTIMLMAFATGCDTGSGPDVQTLASTSSKKCYTVDGVVVGKLESVKMCPSHHPKEQDSLCYKSCKKNYKGVGPVCWEKCKKKERDTGAFCAKKCNGIGCLNPGKWISKAKKSYGRGVGVVPKKACDLNERTGVGNEMCGRNELKHCTIRKSKCVWNKTGYPICTPNKSRKKWKCCKTEFGDTEDPVETEDTEDLVETEDAEDLVEN